MNPHRRRIQPWEQHTLIGILAVGTLLTAAWAWGTRYLDAHLWTEA